MPVWMLILAVMCTVGLCDRITAAAYRNEINDLQNGFMWVPVPIKAAKDPKLSTSGTANDRKEMDSLYGESYNYDQREYHKSAASYDDAPSGFDSGFGMVQNSVGFSALGFIGFLFFLKLIQDTVTMINGPNGRSSNVYFAKRDVSTSDSSWNGIMSFYVAFINEDDDRCRRQMVCELRTRLIQRYRRLGRMANSLISDVLVPILRDNDSNRMKWFPSADHNCEFRLGYCSKKTGMVTAV